MSIELWLALGGGLGGLILGILVWWYRREYVQAAADRDRARADLAAAQKAAADELQREQGVNRVSNSTFDRYQAAVEAMVARHPELGSEYDELFLRFDASAPS